MGGLLGYAAAGAAAGLGQSIIERAKAAETRAMEALKREWQLQDRATDRANQLQDQQQERDWQLEDAARTRGQAVEDRDWERNNTLADRNSAGDAIARAGDPGNWEDVKRGIFHGESGGDYDALYGYSNREGGQFAGVKVTDMTVDEALAFADPSGPYAGAVKAQVGRVATPMGAYQVVGTTLAAAKKGLGLTGNERMTPELQDKIGRWIYENQGTDAWEGYQGPRRADLARSARADMTRAGVPLSEQAAILGDVLPEQAAPEPMSPAGKEEFDRRNGFLDPNAQPPYNYDGETALRKEFTSLPQVKDFQAQTTAMGRVASAAKEPSAAGDLALIFSFMKILDPQSVVRETEFANAQNAAGVPDQIRNLYNRILSGERLNPDQRADFVGQATRLYRDAENQVGAVRKQYEDIAAKQGLDAARALPNFGYAGELPAQDGPKPGDIVEGYRFLGGDPGEKSSWEKVQ